MFKYVYIILIILFTLILYDKCNAQIVSTPTGVQATYNVDEYKVVPKAEVCKLPPPECEKVNIEKLHEKLKYECPKCTKGTVQTITKIVDKIVEKPVYRDVIKTVEKIIEKKILVEVPAVKKNVLRLIGGVGPDGMEAGPQDTEYLYWAKTYFTGIAGVGYTRFLNEDIGVGIQVMTNKTLTGSLEFAF